MAVQNHNEVWDDGTPRYILKHDSTINRYAREGDNDAAYEYSVWQRQYYEMYATDPDELREWRRRKEWSAGRMAELFPEKS